MSQNRTPAPDITAAVHRSWWTVDRDLGVGAELQYTENGVCVMPGLTMTGPDEIAQGYVKRQANGPRLSRHLVSNLLTEDPGEGRAVATYVLTLYAGNGHAPLPLEAPSAICDVRDEFRIVDDQWLIERRTLEPVFVAATNDSVLLGRGDQHA